MRIYNADSYTAYCEPIIGLLTWAFNFQDGYIDKGFVKGKYLIGGVWAPVEITIESSTVTLARPLPPCDAWLIYRDTPKDNPIVVYGNGGTILQDESRNVAARQSMHVLVELVDAGHLQYADCICGCSS
jgi:hypothetical protein